MAGRDVLLVDDDPELRALVTLILEDAGHRVRSAGDGREALEAVERGLPDLILLDMRMPVMNGWEFAAAFHERWDKRRPIVVLTAAENPRARAAEIDAEGWLGKPFAADELLDAVQRFALPREAR